MSSPLRYKGYEGTAEMDLDRGVCHGRILHIDDLVTYQAATVKDLRSEFEAAVDDYLETCKALGRQPKRPYGGIFNVRTSPDKHAALAMRATREGRSLNALVNEAFDAYLTVQGAISTEEFSQVRISAVHENLLVVEARHKAYGKSAPTVLGGDVDVVSPVVNAGPTFH